MAIRFPFTSNEPIKLFDGNLGELLSKMVTNIFKKYTNSGLTDTEKEANEFSRSERLEAQDWTAQREDTQMQRAVADYKAAGINPMMLAGGSINNSSPSQPAQSVSPNLGDALQMLLLPKQMQLLDSQILNNNASAGEKTTKVKLWEMKSDEAFQKIKLMESQIATELEKQGFYFARAALANVNAENIVYLQKAIKDMYEAQANLSGNAAKKEAALATLTAYNSMYQAKILESGYIEQMVSQIVSDIGLKRSMIALNISQEELNRVMSEKGRAETKLTEAEAAGRIITNRITSGNYTDLINDENLNWWDAAILRMSQFTQTIGNIFQGTLHFN